jgi:hypothetical protein
MSFLRFVFFQNKEPEAILPRFRPTPFSVQGQMPRAASSGIPLDEIAQLELILAECHLSPEYILNESFYGCERCMWRTNIQQRR